MLVFEYVLTMLMLIGVLLFTVRGSRPRRTGKPTEAHTIYWLRRYATYGIAARAAVGIPLAWATGELIYAGGLSPLAAFVAAGFIVTLAYAVAPLLETAVGAAALVIEVATLGVQFERAFFRFLIGGAVIGLILVIVFAARAFKLGALPLVLAACLEIGVLSMKLGIASEASLGQIGLSASAVLAALGLIAMAPTITLALLGVAMPFGSLLSLVALGPDYQDEAVVCLVAMSASLPAAAATRFLPSRTGA